jgi:hypothetical protein
VALLLLCGRAPAQPDAGDAKTVEGVVKSLTTAPRGEVDGAVLNDGTVIHWSPHLADRFTAIIDKGDRIKATGRMETGPEGETHLEVQTVTNTRTKGTRENDDPPPPPPDKPGRRGGRVPPPPDKPRPGAGRVPPPPPPGPDRPANADLKTVKGSVRRMTTAPMGEVDGAVLDDGTVIHWPPHLERRFTAIVSKGAKVKASGWMETGPEGDSHLEVQTVTNTNSGASRDNDAAPGRVGRRPADDAPADLERRLRAIEDRLDRLTRELERRR